MCLGSNYTLLCTVVLNCCCSQSFYVMLFGTKADIVQRVLQNLFVVIGL